jgi:hypothetical protein
LKRLVGSRRDPGVPDHTPNMYMSQIIIPKTQLLWTQAFARVQEEYDDFLKEIPKRPIVVWFSTDRHAICQLHKLTNVDGDDHWIIIGYNCEIEQSVTVTNNPLPLKSALTYLSCPNGWVMAEFKKIQDFHLALLRYMED